MGVSSVQMDLYTQLGLAVQVCEPDPGVRNTRLFKASEIETSVSVCIEVCS